MQVFSFRGGEFGNWLNENERQASLDYGYDAFKDLAKALDISDRSISLGGDLAIAFGSRGKGGSNAALAHYEPTLNVINLTKVKGAGTLAHEWGHALDYYLRKKLAVSSGRLENLKKVIHALKYKEGSTETTEYYKNSQLFDQYFSKNDKGYWKSDEEMFARAFACYIKDKVERNDYLCGHADSNVTMIQTKEGMQIVWAYPVGQERKYINRCMDEMMQEIKEKHLLQADTKRQYYNLKEDMKPAAEKNSVMKTNARTKRG